MSHTANRVAMATRIADFLERHSCWEIDTLAEAGDDAWARIAELAGEQRVPSPSTRACVLIALRERQRPLNVSLLEGLPT